MGRKSVSGGNAISTSSAILGTTFRSFRTQGKLSAVPDRAQVTAVKFHNALESRHGNGSQTPHSP